MLPNSEPSYLKRINMKFTKNMPKESGYYWYIDKEYPNPFIGFVANGSFYEKSNRDYTNYIGRFILIGDFIPAPDCRDNIIED